MSENLADFLPAQSLAKNVVANYRKMSKKGKKWSELTFKEKRKIYLYGTIAFTFFLGITFFMTPDPSKKELQTKKTYLISDPKFSKKEVITG